MALIGRTGEPNVSGDSFDEIRALLVQLWDALVPAEFSARVRAVAAPWAKSCFHEPDEEALGPLTDDDWARARQSLGKGSRSILFGTSRKALDEAVERLSKAHPR